jgi:hypothetical protein
MDVYFLVPMYMATCKNQNSMSLKILAIIPIIFFIKKPVIKNSSPGLPVAAGEAESH